MAKREFCRVCGTILQENAERWSKYDRAYCSKECLRTDYLARAIALRINGDVVFDYDKFMAGEVCPQPLKIDADGLKDWQNTVWNRFRDDCTDRNDTACNNAENETKICDKLSCPRSSVKKGALCPKCNERGLQEIIEKIDGNVLHKGMECPKCHYVRRPRI